MNDADDNGENDDYTKKDVLITTERMSEHAFWKMSFISFSFEQLALRRYNSFDVLMQCSLFKNKFYY